MTGNFEVSTVVLQYENETYIVKEYQATKSERSATAFVRMYQQFVFATALRFTQNYDDADDVAQEVFIKALNSLSSFKGDSNIKTWLYRITTNLCMNFKRKKSFLSLFSKDDSAEEFFNVISNEMNPQQKMESEEFTAKFYKALSELPEKQRETFALRYFDEMPYEEISKLLGTSVGGLKANYFQAVKKLAVYLK